MRGPDGFTPAPADRLLSAHEGLNEFLAAERQREAGRASLDVKPWKKLPKRKTIDFIEVILRRLAWLHEHDRELESAHVDRLRLVGLLRVLYTVRLMHDSVFGRFFSVVT